MCTMNNQPKKIYFLFGMVFLACFAGLLILCTILSISQEQGHTEKAESYEISGTLLDSNTTSLLSSEIQMSDSSQFTNSYLEIADFDISETGQILIAYTNDRIAVYDENYRFLYGYIINSESSYYVKWNQKNIQIIFVRGSLCLEISPQGNVVRGLKVDSNNGRLFVDLGKRSSISTNDGTVFRVEKGTNPLSVLSGNHYLKLVKVSPDGTETVLYDVTSANLFKTFLIIVCVILAFLSVLAGIYYQGSINRRTQN